MNIQRLTVDKTDTAGIIDLNGGTITTSAGQTYDGTVKLSSGDVLSDTGGSAISFGPSATVSGAQSLEVETAGTTTFDAAVSVKSLVVDHAGTGGIIDLNGGTVTTTGSQSYDTVNTVNLGADTKLTAGTTLVLGMLANPAATPFNVNGNGHGLTLINGAPSVVNGTINDVSSLTVSTTAHIAKGNLTLNGNVTTTPTGDHPGFLEDTTFTGPTVLTFDNMTVGQKSPRLEVELYGPGGIIFDNSGEVNLVYGSLESFASILFENPASAFLPGLPGISLQIPSTELFDAEGTAIRSAFDLAKKTVVKPEPIEMEVDMRSPSVAGSILLRSGHVVPGARKISSPQAVATPWNERQE